MLFPGHPPLLPWLRFTSSLPLAPVPVPGPVPVVVHRRLLPAFARYMVTILFDMFFTVILFKKMDSCEDDDDDHVPTYHTPIPKAAKASKAKALREEKIHASAHELHTREMYNQRIDSLKDGLLIDRDQALKYQAHNMSSRRGLRKSSKIRLLEH